MEYTQTTLIESARRLAKLHEEPEPGLATWNIMAQRFYEDLRDNVLAEEMRQTPLKTLREASDDT